MTVEVTYTVKFNPGRYKIAMAKGLAQPTWIVGREDDGKAVGFFFEENAALQVCYAMNLADAHLRGDAIETRSLMSKIEKLRDVH